jgi:ubiquinone/menaquinone biosynthesis C-methylase UbiE
MGIFREALGKLAGGRVLDVATGRGGFVPILRKHLGSYSGIVGIDVYERAIQAAHRSYSGEHVSFLQMDAECLAFPDACFDTVCAARSVHHWIDAPQVLGQMARVLRRGGHMVVSDLHRDAQTEAQRTDILLHHWAAEVDTQLGLVHNRTLARQEILDLLERAGLVRLLIYERSDTTSNPLDVERIQARVETIERYLQRAREASAYEVLGQRGEVLRRRLREVGTQGEPEILVVGRKQ